MKRIGIVMGVIFCIVFFSSMSYSWELIDIDASALRMSLDVNEVLFLNGEGLCTDDMVLASYDMNLDIKRAWMGLILATEALNGTVRIYWDDNTNCRIMQIEKRD